ncbi:LysR substrate-binding domain-containing protein [Kluyvera ascorbata]|uniref:DNA-binding transcriptional repressor CitR n=1 Tax=Kluyvera ascorbata TaxID=51288 RepID=UPI002AB9707B|nr:LysR substrate-binding domain-containing protein [Kluyvera ascorbata]MDZ4030543.1 LysR substrate-binding domain-containing protein [Kluyvera ascorbata]
MANLYNLKRFDLNLLVIFECIYQNLSISKAAQTLFITPSAVSQSLQRLRIQLDDPLFVRSGKGISPTTVAENLHLHLVENLNSIEQTINITEKSNLKKRFVVYGPQLHASPKLIRFMNILLEEPNLEVVYHDTAAETDNIEEMMNYRKADVVFTMEACHNRALVSVPFWECPIVLVCRKDHPRLDNTATPEDLVKERFALFLSHAQQVKEFRTTHNVAGLAEKDIAFTSSSLMTIFSIIRQSDLVGFVPKLMYEVLKDTLNLKEISGLSPLPTFTIYMVYSRASLSSPIFSDIMKKVKHYKFIHETDI